MAHRRFSYHTKDPLCSNPTCTSPSITSTLYTVYQQQNGPPGLSLLDHYFLRPSGSFKDNGLLIEFQSLSYTKYYELFRFSDMRPQLINHPNHFLERPGPVGSARKLVIHRSNKVHITKIKLTNPSNKE